MVCFCKLPRRRWPNGLEYLTAIIRNDIRGITTAQYFKVWNAELDLSPIDDLPLVVGQRMQSLGINPACFALQCSPDLITGACRLSVYKVLVGPMTVEVIDHGNHVDIELGSIDPHHPLPTSMAAMEMVHLVSTARVQSRCDVSPIAVSLANPDAFSKAFQKWNKCTPTQMREELLEAA